VLQRKIRVNVISAGVIPTSPYKALGLTRNNVTSSFRRLPPRIPFGRAGTVEEVDKAGFFLASDDSSYVNGMSSWWTAALHRFDNGHLSAEVSYLEVRPRRGPATAPENFLLSGEVMLLLQLHREA